MNSTVLIYRTIHVGSILLLLFALLSGLGATLPRNEILVPLCISSLILGIGGMVVAEALSSLHKRVKELEDKITEAEHKNIP